MRPCLFLLIALSKGLPLLAAPNMSSWLKVSPLRRESGEIQSEARYSSGEKKAIQLKYTDTRSPKSVLRLNRDLVAIEYEWFTEYSDLNSKDSLPIYGKNRSGELSFFSLDIEIWNARQKKQIFALPQGHRPLAASADSSKLTVMAAFSKKADPKITEMRIMSYDVRSKDSSPTILFVHEINYKSLCFLPDRPAEMIMVDQEGEIHWINFVTREERFLGTLKNGLIEFASCTYRPYQNDFQLVVADRKNHLFEQFDAREGSSEPRLRGSGEISGRSALSPIVRVGVYTVFL